MKTDYKVGDFIIRSTWNGKAYKIASISGNDFNVSCGNNNEKLCGYTFDDQFRLATPEEIIKAGGIPNNLITFNYLIL